MSDSTKVGRSVADYTIGERQAGYSQVVINVDSETSYSSGTTSGATLTFENPSGTSTMASNVLSAISGYAYQPYTASDALLDPSAELGDGVTVASIYSVIAQTNITFDPLMGVDLSAPNGGEITSEYPYLSPIQRAVEAAQDMAQDAYALADEASDDADAANLLIQGFQYPGSAVQINGANILANTVTASKLQGGTVQLLNYYGNVAGDMSITGSSSADFAISLESNGALSLQADSGAVNISNPYYYLQVGTTGNSSQGNFFPNSDGSYSCGTSGFRWSVIYSTTSAINTSDAQKKKDIIYSLDDYDAFFDDLKPVKYKFIENTSNRTHTGLIAQDIEENLADKGISTQNFAGFIKTPHDDDSGYDYGLRYEEFIALLIDQVQKLKTENASIKERLTALEEKLNGR